MTDLPLEISVADAAASLRGPTPPLLLDCRTPDEHQTARIAGAVLIPMQELPDRLGALAGREAEPIIVHRHPPQPGVRGRPEHGGRHRRLDRRDRSRRAEVLTRPPRRAAQS